MDQRDCARSLSRQAKSDTTDCGGRSDTPSEITENNEIFRRKPDSARRVERQNAWQTYYECSYPHFLSGESFLFVESNVLQRSQIFLEFVRASRR